MRFEEALDPWGSDTDTQARGLHREEAGGLHQGVGDDSEGRPRGVHFPPRGPRLRQVNRKKAAAGHLGHRGQGFPADGAGGGLEVTRKVCGGVLRQHVH